ncbi:MAG: sigma-54 dependent transcriptional regulator [Desulfobacteraceae bacterium]|jgi:DNA-binding NtrC family response regulator
MTDKAEPLSLKWLVASHGYHACITNGDQNYLKLVEDQKPQLVIACMGKAKPKNSLNTLQKIRRASPTLPIILITDNSSEALAIAAIKAGVSDYFISPYSREELLTSINQHVTPSALSNPTSSNHKSSCSDSDRSMVCTCKQMRELKAYLLKVAALDTTVLITGETGTGKDLAAEIIHKHSPRSRKPLVCVNCAALPENLVESELFGHKKGTFTGALTDKKGTFEIAAGGTLFLDEISEMSPLCQAKILRSIESKTVYPLGSYSAVATNVRIVAATNRDPEKLISKGKFREDLYYRLNVVRINLPPLRERKEDIPQLISNGIERLNRKFSSRVEGISKEAITAMLFHQWPGNIRELNNTLESAFINCRSRQIEFVDLPPAFSKNLNFIDDPHINERDKLLAVLTVTSWNKTLAAKKLNWSRMRVYRALKRYRLVEKPQTI